MIHNGLTTPLTPLYDDHYLADNSRASTRNRYLSIRKLLILDSKVVRATPSLLAAPSGPEMRPPVSASAASMSSRSCLIRDDCRATGGVETGVVMVVYLHEAFEFSCPVLAA